MIKITNDNIVNIVAHIWEYGNVIVKPDKKYNIYLLGYKNNTIVYARATHMQLSEYEYDRRYMAYSYGDIIGILACGNNVKFKKG